MLRPLLCFVVVLALRTACAAAEDVWDKEVTVNLNEVSVRAALESLFRGSGLNFAIEADVQGVIPSLSIKNVPFRAALDSIAKTGGLVYRVDGGIVFIAKRGLGEKGKTPVTVDAQGTPLRDVLDILSKETGVTINLDPMAKDLIATGFSVRDVPLEKALDQLAQQTGTQYAVAEDGTANVRAKPSVGNWQKPVDLEVKDIPLTDALEMLFKGTGISYTVDSNIAGLRVSAVLKNIPLQVALRSITRAAGATYRTDSDVVIISPKALPTSQMNDVQAAMPVPVDAIAPGFAPQAEAAPVDAAKQKQISQVLNFKYVNAGDVAPILARPGVRVSTTNSSQSIITGPEDAVQEAASLVAAIDNESAYPRPVRLKLDVKIDLDGKTIRDYSTEGIGLSGEYVGLILNVQSGGGINLNVQAMPTIERDGRIGVRAQGHFSWRGFLNASDTCSISQPLSNTSSSVQPGKPTTISSGRANAKSSLTFEIILTATIEEGRVYVPGRIRKPKQKDAPSQPAGSQTVKPEKESGHIGAK